MRAILYDPDHCAAVTRARQFLLHLGICPDCKAFHDTEEGQAAWRDLAGYLSQLTPNPVTDPADAMNLCDAWLQAHEVMGMLGLNGTAHDPRAN